MHTYMHTNYTQVKHTNIHTYKHTNKHAYMDARIHTDMHAHIHTSNRPEHAYRHSLTFDDIGDDVMLFDASASSTIGGLGL